MAFTIRPNFQAFERNLRGLVDKKMAVLRKDLINEDLGEEIGVELVDLTRGVIKKAVKPKGSTSNPSTGSLARSYETSVSIREGRRMHIFVNPSNKVKATEHPYGGKNQSKMSKRGEMPFKYSGAFDTGRKAAKGKRFVPVEATRKTRVKKGTELGWVSEVFGGRREVEKGKKLEKLRESIKKTARWKAMVRRIRGKAGQRSMISGRLGDLELHHIIPLGRMVEHSDDAWDPKADMHYDERNYVLAHKDEHHGVIHAQYGTAVDKKIASEQKWLNKMEKIEIAPGLGMRAGKTPKRQFKITQFDKTVTGPGCMVPVGSGDPDPGFKGTFYLDFVRDQWRLKRPYRKAIESYCKKKGIPIPRWWN